MLKVVECEGQIERKTIDKPFHDLWLAFVHCSSRGREKTLRGGTWGIPQPRLHAISDVRSVVTRLWREFSEQYGGAVTQSKTIWANSLKMEDWDIPNEDDFESRYADELEMLDDFEGRCELRC